MLNKSDKFLILSGIISIIIIYSCLFYKLSEFSSITLSNKIQDELSKTPKILSMLDENIDSQIPDDTDNQTESVNPTDQEVDTETNQTTDQSSTEIPTSSETPTSNDQLTTNQTISEPSPAINEDADKENEDNNHEHHHHNYRERYDEAREKAKNKWEEVKTHVNNKYEETKQAAQQKVDEAKQKYEETKQAAQQKADQIKADAQQKADEAKQAANDTVDKFNKQKDDLFNKIGFKQINNHSNKHLTYLELRKRAKPDLIRRQNEAKKLAEKKQQVASSSSKNRPKSVRKQQTQTKNVHKAVETMNCSVECINICKVNNIILENKFVDCAKKNCKCKDVNEVFRSI